jgi:flavin reductase (DIM6/NTAB) family NADH-FMN oxidoreductase RutF
MKQQQVIPADSRWVEKNIREFPGAPFTRIGDEWMLVTAGNVLPPASPDNWNTMTASWGGLGVLWSKDVAIVYVRPVRYTYKFFNSCNLFSLSFFDKRYRGALEICGSKSGRDTDKAAETGLTPVVFSGGKAAGGIGFQEASETIICRKLYTHDFDPAKFLDPLIDRECYPAKDYHRMFIGEIVSFKARA